MNAKGVYTPEQLQDYVDKSWEKFNPEDSAIVDKEVCKNICEKAVNGLGAIGDG